MGNSQEGRAGNWGREWFLWLPQQQRGGSICGLSFQGMHSTNTHPPPVWSCHSTVSASSAGAEAWVFGQQFQWAQLQVAPAPAPEMVSSLPGGYGTPWQDQQCQHPCHLPPPRQHSQADPLGCTPIVYHGPTGRWVCPMGILACRNNK